MSRHPDYAFVRRQMREYLIGATIAAMLFIVCVGAAFAVHLVFLMPAGIFGCFVIIGVLTIEDIGDTLKKLDKGWDE